MLVHSANLSFAVDIPNLLYISWESMWDRNTESKSYKKKEKRTKENF
jgi:hypothetical protein